MILRIEPSKRGAELRYYHRNREEILRKKAALSASKEVKEKHAKYRAKNEEKIKATANRYRISHKADRDAYFEKNKAEIYARRRARYAENKAERQAKRRAAYAENPQPVIDGVRRWAQNNREKVKAKSRAWAIANPEKVRILSSTKRARKRAQRGKLSSGIASKLMTLQRGKCACCRADLSKAGHHLDHIEPLALGGAHDDKNMQLLCKACNLSKHAKHPVEFMQSRGYLL